MTKPDNDWTAHARRSIHSADLSSDRREPDMTDKAEYTPRGVWVWKKNETLNWRYSNTNRPIAGATHKKALPRGKHPLQLYSLATPNGVKITIMLEELLAADHSRAEYDAWLIRIGEGDQFGSGFVGVNPNSKISRPERRIRSEEGKRFANFSWKSAIDRCGPRSLGFTGAPLQPARLH
jgi:hypothetical protein